MTASTINKHFIGVRIPYRPNIKPKRIFISYKIDCVHSLVCSNWRTQLSVFWCHSKHRWKSFSATCRILICSTQPIWRFRFSINKICFLYAVISSVCCFWANFIWWLKNFRSCCKLVSSDFSANFAAWKLFWTHSKSSWHLVSRVSSDTFTSLAFFNLVLSSVRSRCKDVRSLSRSCKMWKPFVFIRFIGR